MSNGNAQARKAGSRLKSLPAKTLTARHARRVKGGLDAGSKDSASGLKWGTIQLKRGKG
jgi:hypothetical protein